jgi:hypothetical protein
MAPSYLIMGGIATSTNGAALPLQSLGDMIDSGILGGIIKGAVKPRRLSQE